MYKKIILIVSLLLATQVFAQKQALLIGVANYQGENSDLPGINHDIEKMKELFTVWGFKVQILLDKESMGTEKYLEMYANILNKNDTFIFYYTGHGSYALDKNGDEEDGQDESIVLSDGNKNYHYLDDELNYRLNKIKAKKMILFDSCHSGTANRGKSKFMAKTIPSEKVEIFASKNLKLGEEVENGKFVVFSASKDNEQSRASETGSLFTNELYNLLSNEVSNKKTFFTLQNEVTRNIVNICKRNKINPHHSTLSTSSTALKNISMLQYLEVNSLPHNENVVTEILDLQQQLDYTYANNSINKILITNAMAKYKVGENVNFTLNTNDVEGYLTILYVEKNEITVLYPSPNKKLNLIKGEFEFPKDFGNFHIETYKECTNCNEEKTTIYTLLTPQPLTNIQKMTHQKLLSFSKSSNTSKIMSKAVRVVEEKTKTDLNHKVSIGKYEFIVN